MSGGVDSSVAAVLLKEQGYEVVGVYLKNWSDDRFRDCPWEEDFADAKATGKKLGIPVISWNFEREYRAKVIDYFFAEYAAGRTPNPDIVCNKEIKFGLFLARALKEGADYVATGHYARITRIDSNKDTRMDPNIRVHSSTRRSRDSSSFVLAIPKDAKKDQTYFLYTLTSFQLSHVLFPLANMTKEEVRAIAARRQLPTADKPDSQGICFVGEINLVNFLKSRLPQKMGPIMTVEGDYVGEHQGVWFYTIGQRHGLSVGGGIPYYVVGKDIKTNTLTVAAGSDHPALYSRKMVVDDTVLQVDIVDKVDQLIGFKAHVRIRHGMEPQPATINRINESTNQLLVVFDDEQRAITPGQAAVFYKKGIVLGGGTIGQLSLDKQLKQPVCSKKTSFILPN
jgi:tRNA-specific 2-thiouridylase